MKKKVITISAIAVVAIIAIVFIANYQEIFKSVVPPAPFIVSSEADGSSSTLFEYSVRVKGVVRNQGGNGEVVVEATLTQGDNAWTKTTKLYLTASETANFEIIFDEAKLLDSDPEYTIKAYALGSLSN